MSNYTYSDDPRSAVKNKLGARTHDELDKLEAKHVFRRNAELEAGYGPQGQFDAAHLKAIHRHLFQDVYEWAGRTRDERVQLSDGTVATEPLLRKVDGQPFMPGPQIPVALDSVAATIRDAGQLRGLSREAFAKQAADLMAAINAAHAFREGNGRTQRTFMRELAREAGHELDFSVISRERMVQASIAANDQSDPNVMRRLFHDATDPARIAALHEAIDFLETQKFPWNDRYIATAHPGQRVEVTLAGTAGAHFMARSDTGILVGNTADLPVPHPERGVRFGFEPAARSEERPPAPLVVTADIQSGARPELLTAFVQTMERHPPPRQFTAGELATNSDARRMHNAQLADAAQRTEAIDRMSAAIKAGRPLDAADMCKLDGADIASIRKDGDGHLHKLVQAHDREVERTKEGRGSREP